MSDSKKKMKFRSRTLPALITVGPVSAWMVLFIAIPMIYVIVMSFCGIDENYNVVYSFTMKNYKRLFNLDYVKIYGQSLIIAFVSTFLALIRIYGWKSFLGNSGVLNTVLLKLHIVSESVDFLYKPGTTILGMVYCLFPFMVLPLYSALEKLDGSLLEASSDLGARKVNTFFEIILPLTSSGIFSGCIMVFIPALGYFFVSDILGGGNTDMIGNLVERQFQSGNNWPLGAALSIILIVITLVLVRTYQKLGGDMESLGV